MTLYTHFSVHLLDELCVLRVKTCSRTDPWFSIKQAMIDNPGGYPIKGGQTRGWSAPCLRRGRLRIDHDGRGADHEREGATLSSGTKAN